MASAPDCYLLPGVGHSVQFLELSLFLVVIDSSYSGDHEDCYENGESVDPGCVSVVGLHSHFEGNGDEGEEKENLQCEVIEGLEEESNDS